MGRADSNWTRFHPRKVGETGVPLATSDAQFPASLMPNCRQRQLDSHSPRCLPSVNSLKNHALWMQLSTLFPRLIGWHLTCMFVRTEYSGMHAGSWIDSSSHKKVHGYNLFLTNPYIHTSEVMWRQPISLQKDGLPVLVSFIIHQFRVRQIDILSFIRGEHFGWITW